MLDLNHLFLFVAIASPLAVLGRAWMPGGTSRGWRTAALVVFGITAVAWLFCRNVAGYIGGGAWFALLFIPAMGLRRVVELAMQHRYAAARRLARVLLFFHPGRDLRDQIAILQKLEQRQAAGAMPGPLATGGSVFGRPFARLRQAPVVTLMIVLNLVAFAITLIVASVMRSGFQIDFIMEPPFEVIHRLGALAFYSVIFAHEYWRTVTSLFLHYGALHLFFNLFALFMLGPALERTIGSGRFAICYLVSGLCSSIGVLLLTYFGRIQLGELVGASGCVMGVVGAWAGFLLRHRHLPQARERLANIVMIILLQIAFDFYTPQVSSSAHLCGLVAGAILGSLVAARRYA